jgi:hypothetical protein
MNPIIEFDGDIARVQVYAQRAGVGVVVFLAQESRGAQFFLRHVGRYIPFPDHRTPCQQIVELLAFLHLGFGVALTRCG